MEKSLALVDPYLGLSHRVWCEGICRFLPVESKIYSMSPRFWKWRMHGGSYTLAEDILASNGQNKHSHYLCSSFVDLPFLKSLLGSDKAKFLYYFHENQFAYPERFLASEKQKLDHNYALIQLKSLMIADRVFFNSHFQKEQFFKSAEKLLRKMPDFHWFDSFLEKEQCVEVLPLALDLQSFDWQIRNRRENNVPILVWNHRWEHDKNPSSFFRALRKMKDEARPFKLLLMGESFAQTPSEFLAAKEEFSDELLHYGFVSNREEYIRLLSLGDIALVTSEQENFGISTIESAYCGLEMIVPDRLVYPETLASKAHFYRSQEEAESFLRKALDTKGLSPQKRLAQKEHFQRFDWSSLGQKYRSRLLF